MKACIPYSGEPIGKVIGEGTGGTAPFQLKTVWGAAGLVAVGGGGGGDVGCAGARVALAGAVAGGTVGGTVCPVVGPAVGAVVEA